MVTDPIWLYEGLAEVPGFRNNPTIMGWIKTLGVSVLGAAINDDETPWCGTFMAQIMKECFIAPPKIAVRASSWDKFGQHCGVTYGAIGRFQRPGGGHVGIIVAKRYRSPKKIDYLVFGGNQSNKVGYTWIARDRLVCARWPANFHVHYQALPIFDLNGEPVSEDEK